MQSGDRAIAATISTAMDIGCRVHAVAQRATRRPQGQPQSAEMARIASANIPMRAERLPSWRRREPSDSIIGRLARTAEVRETAIPFLWCNILSVLTAVVIEVPEAL